MKRSFRKMVVALRRFWRNVNVGLNLIFLQMFIDHEHLKNELRKMEEYFAQEDEKYLNS